MRKILLGAALLAAATVPTLLAASGPIVAPAGAEWTHAGTNVVLPPTLAGLPRGAMTDNSDSQIDVAAQYDDHHGTFATMYLFRPSLMSVPVWFDRSETMILARDVYVNAKPTGETVAFAPPRAAAASGLRRAYLPGGGALKGTALAMMPLGPWLVAVRLSSQTLDPVMLDARMTALIAGIGWPNGAAGGPLAATIKPCATPLAFDQRAKLRKPDMTAAILAAGAASAAIDAHKADPGAGAAPWCREGQSSQQYGVYRLAGSTNGYMMAMGDAGVTVSVDIGLSGLVGRRGYQLSLGLLDRTLIFPAFDRLPSPEMALRAIDASAPVASTSRDAKEISVAQ